MKKFSVGFLTLVIVLLALGYAMTQWQVKKSVNDVFNSLPFVDASFDDAALDWQGRIVVSAINVNIPMASTAFSVREFSIDFGHVIAAYQALFANRGDRTNVPEQLMFSISDFSMRLSPVLLQQIDALTDERDFFSELTALGCGRYSFLGTEQLYDMGLTSLRFSASAGYSFSPETDQLNTTANLSVEQLVDVDSKYTLSGLGELFGKDQSNLSMSGLELGLSKVLLTQEDRGANKMRQAFCARSSGLNVAEWNERHLNMVNQVFSEVGFESDFDLINAYQLAQSPNSIIQLNALEQASISIDDLQGFTWNTAVQALGITLSVNEVDMPLTNLNVDADKLMNYSFNKVRRANRLGTSEDDSNVNSSDTERQQAPKAAKRILTDVPLFDVASVLNRTVQITRSDSKVFTGVLTSVTQTRLTIRTRYKGGFTDLPLQRNQVSSVKVYPEQ